MLLRLLLCIHCGVTRLLSITNNVLRKKANGQRMQMKQNSRKGSDKKVNQFIGEKGALVCGVEALGNQLALLLRGKDGSFRILRWNLRQGGALDWFTKVGGEFVKYPASSIVRNAAWFEFSGLDLSGAPPGFLDGQLFLCQIDCTSTPNQSEWELQFCFPAPSKTPTVFSSQPGWFARHRGIPSMIDDPLGWIAAVKESAKRLAARYPDRPVVLWIGSGTVWEATGFKSKSELLYRFALATCECVFLTMADLVAKEHLVEHLCLCAYLLFSEELPFVQW